LYQQQFQCQITNNKKTKEAVFTHFSIFGIKWLMKYQETPDLFGKSYYVDAATNIDAAKRAPQLLGASALIIRLGKYKNNNSSI